MAPVQPTNAVSGAKRRPNGRGDGASEKQDAANSQREYVCWAGSDRLAAGRRICSQCSQAPNDEKDYPDTVSHAAGVEVHSFRPTMSYTTRRIRHIVARHELMLVNLDLLDAVRLVWNTTQLPFGWVGL